MERFVKMILLIMMGILIIFQPMLITHASDTWKGNSWDGDSWKGKSWDGTNSSNDEEHLDDDSWTEDQAETESWDVGSWADNVDKNDNQKGWLARFVSSGNIANDLKTINGVLFMPGNNVSNHLSDVSRKNTLDIGNYFKGGGIVGQTFTIGSNLVSGFVTNPHLNQDFPAVHFTDALISDGAIAGSTTVISALASTMEVSTVDRSSIPGLGTVIGASIGLGAGLLLCTAIGCRVRGWMQNKVKAGLDFGATKVRLYS